MPHPPPRGEQGEETVARVGGVSHDLSCPPQRPGVMQGLEGGQGMANHPLRRAYHPLQLDEVFCSCSGEPGDNGVGEDGLDDGRVELGHHQPVCTFSAAAGRKLSSSRCVCNNNKSVRITALSDWTTCIASSG